MKPRKSPQDKKSISLSKDRRRRTGGNVHTARKAYAKSKREISGNYRSKARQALKSGPVNDPDVLENRLREIERLSTSPPGNAVPLGEMVARKKQARKDHHGRDKELRRLKKIWKQAFDACVAEIRRTPRYREATELKVKDAADFRLRKFYRDLFADFSGR